MQAFFERNMAIAHAAIDRFLWSNRPCYAQFLAQTYYYVAHSSRLLAAAAARFSLADDTLHRRFLTHSQDKRSQHLLAAHDLRELGYDVADFSELPTTAALYEPQYYKSEYLGPTTLLGYILALEGTSVTRGEALYKQVSDVFGQSAATFLKAQTEGDVEHLATVFAIIDGLEGASVRCIESNFVQSCMQYAQFLDGVRTMAHREVSDTAASAMPQATGPVIRADADVRAS